MAKGEISSVLFPPVGKEDETRLTKLLEDISEFMKVPIKVEKVTTIRARIAGNRADVVLILNKIAANEKTKDQQQQAKDQQQAES